jgi:amino-acid N-acetyltransferase
MIRGRPPRAAALALLHAHGLPVLDLTDEHLQHFFFAGPDGSLTGLVGLEIYDSVALLRSLVVDENARGTGLGAALTHHAEHYSASKNVGAIYLLTTTAELFFRRLGYQRVDRTLAPPAIEHTREFAELCPTGSAFMVKSLKQKR